jgi:hypothetical protein
MYILYFIKWITQPGYIKVGYGNLQRPKSSSYSTPFGSDGVVTVYIPEKLYSKEETFQIEQQLHNFLKETKRIPNRENGGGEEVYRMSSEQACFYIEEFIRTNRYKYYQTYTARISKYKQICKINPKLYSIIESIELNDVKQNCELCNRDCTSKIYKCQILNNEDYEDTKEIFVGSTCIQKFYTNISIKSILNKQFCKKNFNSPLEITNQCISKSYKNNLVININYEEEKEGEISVYFNTKEHDYYKSEHQRMILLAIYNYIFNEKKTFKVDIDNRFIYKYKLSDNIYTIYGLLHDIAYFQLGELLQNTTTGELFFSLKFVHPEYDKKRVKNRLQNLNNERSLRIVQSDWDARTNTGCRFCIEHAQGLPVEQPESRELTEEEKRNAVFGTAIIIHKDVDLIQTDFLVSTNPFVSGAPGTGKSQIITHAIQHNPYEKFLIITPTYSTLNGLYEQFSKYPNVQAMVIQSIHPYTLSLLNFVPSVVFVDEYGMFSIFDFVKLLNLVEQIQPTPIIKIFGDPYQLPPISFSKETKPISRMIFSISNKLLKSHRPSVKARQIYEEVINTKCNLNLNWLNQNLQIESYNDKTIISHFYKKYRFLSYSNETVNTINMTIYNYIKSIKCPQCPSVIQIGEQYFCFDCINKFEFIFTNNIQKKKNMLNIEPEVLEKINSKKIFYNGENIEFESSSVTGHLNIRSTGKHQTGKPVIKLSTDKLRFLKVNLSYAQTIHKSQGQSLDNVFIVLDSYKVESSALYTAITRGKNNIKLCYKDVETNTVRVIRNNFDDVSENESEDECKSETSESQSTTSVEYNPHQTPIGWGKLKGRHHSILLNREQDYARWILETITRPKKEQLFTVSYLNTFLKKPV